jgi:hypothetical protein
VSSARGLVVLSSGDAIAKDATCSVGMMICKMPISEEAKRDASATIAEIAEVVNWFKFSSF